MKTKLLSTSILALLAAAAVGWQAKDAPPSQPAPTTTASQTKPAAATRSTPFPASKKAAKPAKPPKPPWTEFKLNPKATLFLDFTDANPDMILLIYSRTSGITILKDPSFKVALTVTSAKSVGLNDAFEILENVLEMNGYQLTKKGKMMVVGKIPPAQPPTPPPSMPTPPAQDQDQPILKVFHLEHASSQQVARVINEVFTQQQLESMVQQLQSGGGFAGPPGMGMGMGMPGRPQAPKTVRASSDDYSNSVVVNAPPKFMTDVEKLVTELDKTAEQPLESQIFKLNHVNVDEVVNAIQDILTANSPTGRGAKRSNDSGNNPYMAIFGYNPFGSRGGASSGGQTAVAIKPTNSIVVSATKDNMEMIKKLIANMDVATDYVGTTYVIHLENAKATDVAELLNSAFTKPRNNSFDSPFFYIYSDFGQQQNKSDITTDVTEDGKLVNVRDLTGKVNIMADPNTNSLIVVTIPSNIKLIRSIIEKIDRISEQVMIETIIVEANLSKETKLGVEWSFLNHSGNVTHEGNTDFGLQTATDPLQGFKYTLTGPDYNVFVNALQTDTRFKVLSTPRIFTSNNVKAEIDVSQQVPYITAQQTGVNGGLISNYDFKTVGVVLTVTPRITSGGDVSMDVVQSADDLQGFTTYNAPIINHRQASTTATVKDGETIVLGGIIRQNMNLTENKIPILGDIPLIGNLFRSTSRVKGQTELMVLLTPHIVHNNAEAQKLREEEEKRLSKGSQDEINKTVKPK